MAVYHSARTLAESYDVALSTARAIIREVRQEIDNGRYPPDTILDGCGVRIEESALIDYLKYRRALKNEIAKQYVPPFEGVKTWSL